MNKKRLITIIICIVVIIGLLVVISDWENFKAGLSSKPSVENTQQ